ncbi:hypothetical protein IV203_001943 [Nitzschia inconspicua]|uniref:Uncharacterized protein n=1 Tax=Nitzschia inconspicua TaxID=303405 RepID=A0A9K3L969_9STRA|nr:hypothetical protein IV203_001943 [Nitzschia inconspicua]
MVPPTEKSPVLILHWSDRDNKLKEKLIQLVKQQIRNESKLLILPNPSPDCLWLTTTQHALEEKAEKNFLIKNHGKYRLPAIRRKLKPSWINSPSLKDPNISPEPTTNLVDVPLHPTCSIPMNV